MWLITQLISVKEIRHVYSDNHFANNRKRLNPLTVSYNSESLLANVYKPFQLFNLQ